MPIHDYLCADCGVVCELLAMPGDDTPACGSCGGRNLNRLLSAPSSLSGPSRQSFPGAGDTSCCGSSPVHAGCGGPGSCCGKAGIG